MRRTGVLAAAARIFVVPVGLIPVLLVAFASSQAWAERGIPAASSRIVDEAGVLSTDERGQLETSLASLERTVGPQILVLTIPSLEGEAIEAYSIRVADQWKPGHAKRDDGVLVVLATEDHKVRIEVGQGLEGTLPDVLAGRIIREQMVPYFKTNRYRDGLVSGLQAIAVQLGGTLEGVVAPEVPRRVARNSGERPSPLMIAFLAFLLFFVLLPRVFGRRGPGRSSGGSFLTGLILGNVLSSSSNRDRGWGGGGGGFGGGGGGGFSGGGASGDW